MHRHRSASFAALLLALSASAGAATRNGDPDPNFGVDGAGVVDIGAGDGSWVDLVRTPTGKLLLAGAYDAGAPTGLDMVVARLNADGSLDESFSFDGKVEIVVGPGDSDDVMFDLLVQPDGRIVLVGGATSPVAGDGIDMVIVRLDADGSFDGSFGVGGKVFIDFGLGGAQADDVARSVARFADGKLVVAGTTPVTGQGTDMALVKLNPNGSRDTSFGTGGRATVRFQLSPTHLTDEAAAVAIDSLGRVVVAGSTQKNSADDSDFAVARLLANGQLDPAFSGDGRHTVAFDLGSPFEDKAYGLVIGADDSITLTGSAKDNGSDMAVVRLNPDGSPMANFGSGGKVTVPFDVGGNNDEFAISAMAHRDRLLLVGTGIADFGGPDPEQVTMAAQLLADGQLDADFGSFGKVVLANSIGGTVMASSTALPDGGRALLATVASDVDGDPALVAQSMLLDVLFSDGYDID